MGEGAKRMLASGRKHVKVKEATGYSDPEDQSEKGHPFQAQGKQGLRTPPRGRRLLLVVAETDSSERDPCILARFH
jgi:hypothetical protein